ncbi:dimethylhistidine N-methyltransferase [Halopseudomonas litoralis]|uniref:Dimethylhistidine N-methyltransferase n=1 Tax=Halopseudomonas litoralis TaxID=797277 RepID=A0A1H1LJI9_9GAMM|nr:L-histidine N(alpha)-methyltransferase [Halopseudomonas litoralis]SDR74676.1 dimethylhistidine N-methyltransferase [Halopseudomonas litoralis]
MNIATPLPRLENLLPPDLDNEHKQLLEGLLQPQACINPKYFYDDTGCELFTRICELEEYYPTRTEAAIFEHSADDISAALVNHAQWIDLGCGDCSKSRRWLQHVTPARLIGVDIAGDFLQTCLADIAHEHPELECIGVVSDFTQRLDLGKLLAEDQSSPPMFFYPGSSIGNFARADALSLLRCIRRHCGDSGQLLIGIDLVKPPPILEAAYDDAEGVTAEFNLNVLQVANRLLHADFEPANFAHQAVYDPVQRRIEMRLVAQQSHNVQLQDVERHFDAGEYILTEYSHKYTTDDFSALLAEAGFHCQHLWTDPQEWFGVFLAEP